MAAKRKKTKGVSEFKKYINAPSRKRGRKPYGQEMHDDATEEIDRKKNRIRKKITIRKKF